jgi:xanthine dehydrogenase YagS FAD-binding subunit
VKSFDIARPADLVSATAMLKEWSGGQDPEARERVKVMAGGQDLLGELKDHLVEPERLVDLKRLPGLDGIEPEGDGLALGALATITAVEEDARIAKDYGAVAEAAASVASPQIRNVGTVGGNLCQRPRCWYYRNEQTVCLKRGGDECFSYGGMSKYNAILGGGPSYIVHPSDLATALVAHGAEVTLTGAGGERRLPLERFFTLPSEGDVLRENVLAQDEILTRVHLAPLPGSGWKSTYLKFKERSSYDWALAAVAMVLAFDGRVVREARIVLGGVAPIPWRVERAEQLLVGKTIDAELCAAVGAAALQGHDALRHNAYKVALTEGLITKTLTALSG